MKKYIQDNRERCFEELFSLLRIPSISAKPEHKADMYRCAQRLAELLREAGADKADVYETAGHPVVFGSKEKWIQSGGNSPTYRRAKRAIRSLL